MYPFLSFRRDLKTIILVKIDKICIFNKNQKNPSKYRNGEVAKVSTGLNMTRKRRW